MNYARDARRIAPGPDVARTSAVLTRLLGSCPCCCRIGTSLPSSRRGGWCWTRTTRRCCSRRASMSGSTGYFRLFDNHKYAVIDPAEHQPELTRLVETKPGDAVHPAPGGVRARVDVRGGDAAGRHRGAARGEELAGPARPADPLDGRLRRPGVHGAHHARAEQRRDAADQAVARHEDRAALLLPAQLAGGEAVRVGRVRLPVPGPARARRRPGPTCNFVAGRRDVRRHAGAPGT